MGVPGPGPAVGPVEDLDEPDSALNHPPGRQTHLAETAGHVLVQSIQAAVAGDSSLRLTTSGTAVCMRKASSYDLIRARSAGSSGYLAADSRFSRPSSSNSPACSSRKTSLAGRREWERVPRDRPKAGCRHTRGPGSSPHARPARRSSRRSAYPSPRTGASRRSASPGHSEPTSRSSETTPSSMCRPVWNCSWAP